MTVTWFVGNVSFNATEDDVRQFLEAQDVEVLDIRFMRDERTRDFVGYGFAEVASSIDPAAHDSPFRNQKLLGRTLRLEISRGRGAARRNPDSTRRERGRMARERVLEGAR